MDNNTNQSPGGQNMDPTKALYEKLISEVYKYKLEEREMALDRYRRADAQMDSAESFILMGKNAIDFLKQAANASDGIERLAKEIKSIVYKDDTTSNVEVNFNDATKRALIDAIKEEEEKDNQLPDEDLED
jgi:hypothetical protein